MKRAQEALTLGAALLFFSASAGCGESDACLALALRECECCSQEFVEDCKTTMEWANEETPPDDLSAERCEEVASFYRGCEDTKAETLALICVPLE
ncbi:MAG: hypothetical protein JRH20_12175 [Deltaproteobacteria bacterium]|nr:hypothetical protein [Deltaproteobacteria bacterium]